MWSTVAERSPAIIGLNTKVYPPAVTLFSLPLKVSDHLSHHNALDSFQSFVNHFTDHHVCKA